MRGETEHEDCDDFGNDLLDDNDLAEGRDGVCRILDLGGVPCGMGGERGLLGGSLAWDDMCNRILVSKAVPWNGNWLVQFKCEHRKPVRQHSFRRYRVRV